MGPDVEGKEAGLPSEAEAEAGNEDGARPQAEAVGIATSMGVGEAGGNIIECPCHPVKRSTALI